MKMLLTAAAAAVLGLGAPASAQQTQAAPAAAPADDLPTRLALVQRYMHDVHIDALLANIMDSMTDAMLGAFKREHPNYDQAMLEKLSATTKRVLDGERPKLLAITEGELAKVYDREELEAMVQFYESPVGVRIIAKSPTATAATQKAVQVLVPQIEADERKAVCAELKCPAESPSRKSS